MNFDTIILNGNSTNAIITLGALQCLYDDERLTNVDKYVGTSSGSIISTLLAIGYAPLEILTHICIDKSYNKISFNFGNLILLGKGLMSIDPIMNVVNELIIRKHGHIPTFLELKNVANKTVVCVTFNVTTNEKQYLSVENVPDLPVNVAIQMSCTFPFVFDPFEYDGNVYLDGGIVDNFAVDYGEQIGHSCLGLYTRNVSKPYTNDAGKLDLLYRILKTVFNSLAEDKIEKIRERTRIITIDYAPGFFDFTSSNNELIKMFDCGYDICKTFQF